jgi:glutathione S-transferase
VGTQVNTALLARTFLVGTGLTLADLLVFAVLQPTCHKLAPAELVFLCNLTRWADYVYMVGGAAGLFKCAAPHSPPPPTQHRIRSGAHE